MNTKAYYVPYFESRLHKASKHVRISSLGMCHDNKLILFSKFSLLFTKHTFELSSIRCLYGKWEKYWKESENKSHGIYYVLFLIYYWMNMINENSLIELYVCIMCILWPFYHSQKLNGVRGCVNVSSWSDLSCWKLK